MNASPDPAPAPDAAPHSVIDRLFSLYRDSIPAQKKEQFLAILDRAPCGTPKAQWIMDALDALDALIDPYRPLPEDARRARGAIRLACMEVLMKQLGERRRRNVGELPL